MAQVLVNPVSREGVKSHILSRYFKFFQISLHILVKLQIPKTPFQTLYYSSTFNYQIAEKRNKTESAF